MAIKFIRTTGLLLLIKAKDKPKLENTGMNAVQNNNANCLTNFPISYLVLHPAEKSAQLAMLPVRPGAHDEVLS